MKCFHCGECGTMIFFENDRCLKCNHQLGFLPDALELSALEGLADDQLRAVGSKADGKTYRNCANGKKHGICNWLVPSEDSNPWCPACRLNEMIPDLTDPRNLTRWAKLELAKRRCIYTFLRLGLPITSAADDKRPWLRFKFLAETANSPVKTGHENGLITINVAEADEEERERRRVNLHEPYRTLVGHFRHESGHYYWDQLIANSPELPRFRELFGDETGTYDTALQTYYQQGPPADWAARTVTPYASSHPWEDWAETWAHYLHIVDTLESAAGFGLSIKKNVPAAPGTIKYSKDMDFDRMLAEWAPLTCALNAINRSMGLHDLYPFVISPPVAEKLRFIHGLILKNRTGKTLHRETVTA
jgi:hypothetical protein